MATYDFSDLTVEIDVSVGGALQDITAVTIEPGIIKGTMAMDDVTGPGEAFSGPVSGGLMTLDDITLVVQYEDTVTTGTKALFVGHEGEVRTFKQTYGSTNATSVEVIIMSVEKVLAKGAIDRLSVVLHPTGATTEA